MAHEELLAGLRQAVLDCDEPRAARLAREALDTGMPALRAIDGGLVPGIQEAGRLWDEGEFFLPELVGAAGAMKAAMAVLQPALAGGGSRELGRIVIGTVQGDIHDIGKSLVATLLAANGFAVSDEGADVPVERFVTRARELDADLVCASALLTTTMVQQRTLVEALRAAGLRARVMVGGAPVTPAWAAQIGAAGFADNAVAAVAVARGLVRS
ncbi:MAG: cobalamin-dependent protein [Thermoanaerobaculaceae bacterium]|jgi:corrinoid protein of di/trimethylamine methyltransferase|nr:cobalamin-dependent protein [Thermoanaerobaculaceae bacterium]